MIGSKRFTLSWWHLILGIDLFLVLVTVLRKYPVFVEGRRLFVKHFNLAAEMNSAVWWEMVCLLALALMSYELFTQQKGKQKYAWLVLSIVLAGLSLDEIGSLHERSDAWSSTLGAFGALLAVLVIYSVSALFRNEATKRSSMFILSAFLVFGGVALQEYLEHIVDWPAWSLGIRGGVEEGSELLGVFLLYLGIVPQRTWVPQNSLRAMIPNPFLMKNVAFLILGGALVHSLASAIVPSLTEISRRGNPLVWYPSAVFFLLSSATYWKYLQSSRKKPVIGSCLFFFFLLCSVGFAYRLPKLFGRITALVSEQYLPSLFLFSLVVGLVVLSSRMSGYGSLRGRYFPALLAMPPLCLLSSAPEVHYFAFGLLSYLVFLLFDGLGTLPDSGPEDVKPNLQLVRTGGRERFCKGSDRLWMKNTAPKE